MSRDPEDGKPIDPKTLHKYLYAGGDPVNGVDPLGRAAFEEYEVTIAKRTEETLAYARRMGSLVRCVLGVEILVLRGLDGKLNLHDPVTDLGALSTITGCLSSIFPNLPI
jgi:hypothetical protein